MAYPTKLEKSFPVLDMSGLGREHLPLLAGAARRLCNTRGTPGCRSPQEGAHVAWEDFFVWEICSEWLGLWEVYGKSVGFLMLIDSRKQRFSERNYRSIVEHVTV